jgi:ABC-type transporter Mla subunit MlaD
MAANATVHKKDDKGNFGQTVNEVKDKVQETAQTFTDKAKDTAQAFTDRAKEFGSNMAKSADSAAERVGDNIKSFANTIKENAPREGYMGAASNAVASTVESAGRYLQEQGLTGAAEDMTTMIRRNPIPAVLIGIGLGFLLARATSRS